MPAASGPPTATSGGGGDRPHPQPYTIGELALLLTRLLPAEVSGTKPIVLSVRRKEDSLELRQPGAVDVVRVRIQRLMCSGPMATVRATYEFGPAAPGATSHDPPSHHQQQQLRRDFQFPALANVKSFNQTEMEKLDKQLRSHLDVLVTHDVTSIACDTVVATAVVAGRDVPEAVAQYRSKCDAELAESRARRATAIAAEALVVRDSAGAAVGNASKDSRYVGATCVAHRSMLAALARLAFAPPPPVIAAMMGGDAGPPKAGPPPAAASDDAAAFAECSVGEQLRPTLGFHPARLALPCLGRDEALADPSARAGKLFGGRYIHARKLGEGMFAETHAAFDKATEKWVVLKIIHRTFHTLGGLQNTITREVMAARVLSHKNLLPLIDQIYLPNGVVVLVFPLVAHDLAGLAHYTPLFADPSRLPDVNAHSLRLDKKDRYALAKAVVLAVAEALDHMHTHGAMHRDVKVSNVLVDTDGTVLLCDFGWVRFVPENHGRTELRRLTGPPCALNYRPLEIYLGIDTYNRSIDIYGLGCLLFELLTRHTLFPGEDEIGVVRSILKIQGMPPHLKDRATTFKTLSFSEVGEPIGLEAHCRRYDVTDPAAIDLLQAMVHQEQRQRRSARFVRRHPWLRDGAMSQQRVAELLPATNTYYWSKRPAPPPAVAAKRD